MITYLLVMVVVATVNSFFTVFPVVTIQSLPYIGEELRSILVTMVGYWNSFMDTFPYAVIAWQTFLYVILPFELLLLIGKIILGSRNPSTNVN